MAQNVSEATVRHDCPEDPPLEPRQQQPGQHTTGEPHRTDERPTGGDNESVTAAVTPPAMATPASTSEPQRIPASTASSRGGGTRGSADGGNVSTAGLNLFVGNLSADVTDAMLTAAFEPFGKILSVKVMLDIRTGLSRGYGFVFFSDPACGERALEACHGKPMGARAQPMNICRADSAGTSAITATPRVYVRNIPATVSLSALRTRFSQYGSIKHICFRESKSSVAEGVASSAAPNAPNSTQLLYVEYHTCEEAAAAVAATHNTWPWPGEMTVPILAKVAESASNGRERRQRQQQQQQQQQSSSIKGSKQQSSDRNHYDQHQPFPAAQLQQGDRQRPSDPPSGRVETGSQPHAGAYGYTTAAAAGSPMTPLQGPLYALPPTPHHHHAMHHQHQAFIPQVHSMYASSSSPPLGPQQDFGPTLMPPGTTFFTSMPPPSPLPTPPTPAPFLPLPQQLHHHHHHHHVHNAPPAAVLMTPPPLSHHNGTWLFPGLAPGHMPAYFQQAPPGGPFMYAPAPPAAIPTSYAGMPQTGGSGASPVQHVFSAAAAPLSSQQHLPPGVQYAPWPPPSQ